MWWWVIGGFLVFLTLVSLASKRKAAAEGISEEEAFDALPDWATAGLGFAGVAIVLGLLFTWCAGTNELNRDHKACAERYTRQGFEGEDWHLMVDACMRDKGHTDWGR